MTVLKCSACGGIITNNVCDYCGSKFKDHSDTQIIVIRGDMNNITIRFDSDANYSTSKLYYKGDMNNNAHVTSCPLIKVIVKGDMNYVKIKGGFKSCRIDNMGDMNDIKVPKRLR